MAQRPPDEVFAQHVLKLGLVKDAQLKEALQQQAQRAVGGTPVPLAQILVDQGLLTAAQRENLEEKLQTQREDAKRLGPYRIVKKLGEGGMGAVYLAEDPATGQRVALKVLPKVAAKEADAVARFMREVDAARQLDHPNIVRASGGGQDKGFHYYEMDYVEGETLGDRLKRQGFLPPDEATKMALHVAHGLKYAHGLGFIHRDIKPDNVIVTREGMAKILDMGLSKNIDEAQTFRTVTGVALGTPHYIAPEQARGDKGIDGRADIYSLGATYYHLVTGETPFQGTTAIELIAQHLNKQIPDPRDIRDGIPDGVVHVIRNMMAKKPQDRYRDCGELITDLDLVLGGKSPSSQALEAARSVVGLPMAREARERLRAQLRRQRPGTYRATTRRRSGAAALVGGGIAAAVVLILVLVSLGGSGSAPPREGPTATTTPDPDVTRLGTSSSGPPVRPTDSARPPAEDPRPAKAKRMFEKARELEAASPTDYEAIQKAYAEARFAAEGTPVLPEIAEAFRAFQERRARELAKTPDPGPVAPPPPPPAVTNPPPSARTPTAEPPPPGPDPAPPAPVVKPQPALPALWKILMDAKPKLEKKTAPVKLKSPLETAKAVIEDVTEKGLEMKAEFGGGFVGVTKKPEELEDGELRALLKLAGVEVTPEREKLLAAVAAEREKAETEAKYAKTMEVARTRMARKDWKRAAAILEDALKIKPGDAEARKLLAEAEGHLGPAPTLRLDLGEGVGMDLVYIKPGTFTMGGTDAKKYSWQWDESPPHQVTLTKGYYMGRTEVTRRQFGAFVKATGYVTEAEKEGKAWGRAADGQWRDIQGNNWRTPATFTQTDEHPVVCVSWNDARAFCEWATRKSGRQVRLPTEGEWEYACRAGTAGSWHFGDVESVLGEYGWTNANSGWQTHPVGQKKPNPWGLYDVYGNVWEWCEDWAGPYPSEAVVDPTGAASGDRRCLRGGSWNNDPTDSRSAFRATTRPSSRNTDSGLRVAAP